MTEEKNNSKFKSRKFVVWITATVLTVGSLIAASITNNDMLAEVSKIFAEGWIWISAFYLGANGISKFANKTGGTNESIIMR